MVLVSEGAMFEGGEMVFEDRATDAFGHMKLGGVGDLIAGSLKERTASYNNGRSVDIVNQKLGYMVRCGDPDAIDSIVPMAYGNLALDLILKKIMDGWWCSRMAATIISQWTLSPAARRRSTWSVSIIRTACARSLKASR